MTEAIQNLIERCEKATGPDRELDHRIHGALGIVNADGYGAYPSYEAWVAASIANRWNAPAYTASIDAAVALAEGLSHRHGMKLICFFCAGAQLMPYNADETDPDYHPLAKIDNSVTVGWMSHVAFYKPYGGSVTYGPDTYSHGSNAPLAIILATLRALQSQAAP